MQKLFSENFNISENNIIIVKAAKGMCYEYAKVCFRILKYNLSLEKEKNVVGARRSTKVFFPKDAYFMLVTNVERCHVCHEDVKFATSLKMQQQQALDSLLSQCNYEPCSHQHMRCAFLER